MGEEKTLFKHACIKCKSPYQDSEPDAYYCPLCNEERLRIAKEVDAKRSSIPHKSPISALKEYDEAPKVRGFIIMKA